MIVVLLPYEFLLEQNTDGHIKRLNVVLLPYEFLLEQNFRSLNLTRLNKYKGILFEDIS